MYEPKNNAEYGELSHELTYHRYMLSRGQTGALFRDMSIPEYIALHHVLHAISEKGGGTNSKTYLRDIADELKLTMPQTSKMTGKLRDKGLVSWSHDGDGSEGTYITLTEDGVRRTEKQEAVLKRYYGRVAEKFGRENLTALLRLMTRLEQVMDEELNGKEEERNEG